jgi:hypothetical protein
MLHPLSIESLPTRLLLTDNRLQAMGQQVLVRGTAFHQSTETTALIAPPIPSTTPVKRNELCTLWVKLLL